MKTFTSGTVASALLACAGLFGAAANVHAQELIVRDGLYTFQPKLWNGSYYVQAGCMILSDNGHDQVPSLYHWGGSGWCGLSDNKVHMLSNAQAVWSIYSITATDGRRAHIMKSHFNSRCLIRGENGTAASPSLHMWPLPGGDPKFCGWRTADEVINNGQAAWYFEGDQYSAAWLVSAKVGTQSLGFGPLPTVYPNTVNRSVWATFPLGGSGNPVWEFDLYPMDSAWQ